MSAGNRRWTDRGEAIGHGVSWLARWSTRLALAAVGFVIVWWLIGKLWVVVMPVLLALLITTVLWPPARWLRARGLPPALAATAVLLAGLGVLGGVLALISTSIASGVPEIAESATRALQQAREWMAGPPLNLGDSQLDQLLQQGTDQLQASVGSIANGLLTGVGTVTSGIVTGILALLLAFLFVKDGPRFAPWLRGVIGERAGKHVTVVLERVWTTLGDFIRTQAIVSLVDAVLIGLGLVVLGVPLAVPLAALTFLGGFVPIVGAFVAGALAVLVALVSNGLTAAVIMLVIVVVVQQVEGNVLQPVLQSRSLRLHAAVVLLGVTAGSSLYGIAGAFLAVPVVAAAAVVLRYLGEVIDHDTEERATAEPPEPATKPEPA
ncbi:AI-2E family transporter [Saccharothrix coeruleofusca]|uniref:AI-2E family transporter n=1 Tax=Saccharothrix coeruleofusca TaxID=33919 RepID=UPI00166FD362|nr:AI-2E family transporter [Saccharothrix coeruleofusca]MBP2335919.1 putative PurR-regulated permease PerM [Saccharothrix coeruleofusca]